MDKLNIINSALNLLNGRELVDLTTVTDDQKIAMRYYDTALSSVLTMEKWLCSVKFVTLVEDVTGLIPIMGFTKVYQLPTTITKVISFYLGDTKGVHKQDYLRSGNLFYTSAEDAPILECVELVDCTELTPLLTEIFILKLASLMASILTDVGSGLRVEYLNQVDALIVTAINEIDYSIDNDDDSIWYQIVGRN